ncbi:MAG TPA: cytochrome c oxidase assembly protein [Gaiellaceae bacterium]|nr:cytochrome c oxidase assembly protein [Gaiellaceae bacterium]
MDPLPLVVCGTAAVLYALGRRGKLRLWREASFYSGVVLAFVVLERPFDDWADSWLSVHMTQHIVLMTVVPPLVVWGRPWPRMWLPFPLAARRAVGGALSRSPSFRRGAGFLRRPWVALALQSAMVGVWHVPQLYDAAARNEWIHVLEHVCFVAPALVFWGALLDAPPVRARIDDLHRAVWFTAAMIPSWILAIVLAFATAPVYGAYTSMTDQQVAAGVMWVPGSLTYFVAALIAFYRWLEPGATEAPPAVEPRPEELSWT